VPTATYLHTNQPITPSINPVLTCSATSDLACSWMRYWNGPGERCNGMQSIPGGAPPLSGTCNRHQRVQILTTHTGMKSSHRSNQMHESHFPIWFTVLAQFVIFVTKHVCLNNSTDQSPWQVNSRSTSQILCHLCNRKVHYRVHNSLSQMNSLRALEAYLRSFVNFIVLHIVQSWKWFVPFRFVHHQRRQKPEKGPKKGQREAITNELIRPTHVTPESENRKLNFHTPNLDIFVYSIS
jgi:hypothetical protein